MTSPAPKPTSAQAARRKLVRGAFAAPALLTVYSGNALATGSAKRCLTNQTNTPTMVGVSNSLDNYLRVQLRQTGTTTISYWVRGSDLQIYKKTSNNVYIGNSQWQPFNIVNNTAGALQGSGPGGDIASNPAKFAALRFDANGNVVGIGGSGTNQSALSGTCWHSFAPTL